ncbi:hypothetical protein [Paenibacillus sp. P46E]|uniref:hypothetical protein n=1 Tax=Paenibacillus sp. P46E TaxID=1349436 RepID=UPI00093AD7AC|nr:hypothetical protein [Paenibacillus sp. P46E]OKP95408.1 hypothetical protein A3849_26355 [Paenibacillus sp. P46E]
MDWLGIFNLLVLTITLFVLCIYAWDTNKMQKAASKQLELGIKPLISIEPQNQATYYTVMVSNIGNGTALNIEFDPMILSEDSGVSYKIPFIQSLRAGDSKEVSVTAFMNDEQADNSWMAHLKSPYANRVILLNIKYENIVFEESKQVFEFGIGERKIKMLP